MALGDYFITRHSNLGRLQVCFHLIVASEAYSEPELGSAQHRALSRIFRDCQRCHVAELSVPLLLLDQGPSEASLPLKRAQRRAEEVLRQVKSGLTELGEHQQGLELVNLVLPQSATQAVKGTSVVSAAQSFLRNSFQCV